MPKDATVNAILALKFITIDQEQALVIDPQGDLPSDPAAYARLLRDAAAALQHHADNITLAAAASRLSTVQ